ncbi:hypothetical protein LCGC14_1228100 [marine sediment metagenome]|uniref:DUF5681 domain-containing protein n=1 Tax=marine sediment metagenome TaxID=412755 RepID=A0A0F9LWG0_9ZZZZ
MVNVITDTESEIRERADSEHKVGDWYPGMASPNPEGRPPKGRTLTSILEKLIDKDKLAEELWRIASGESGDGTAMRLEAIKYIYARIEGSPVQAMRFSAEGDMMPLIFLHPGREAPMIEGESKLIEDSADTDNS